MHPLQDFLYDMLFDPAYTLLLLLVVINRKDRDRFLDEIYFFLVDNNMDSVLQERYRVNWE